MPDPLAEIKAIMDELGPRAICSETLTRWMVKHGPALLAKLEALSSFKSYVHKRLDDAGVPTDPDSPHKAEGCRIGGRLDLVFAELTQLREVVNASGLRSPAGIAAVEAGGYRDTRSNRGVGPGGRK